VTLSALLVGGIAITILYTANGGGNGAAYLFAGLAVLVLALLAGIGGGTLCMRITKHHELALLYRIEIFQVLAETAREGIVLADIHGRIEYVNPAVEKLFGYDSGELVGESVEQLMPREQGAAHAGYMNRYLETGVPRIIGNGRQLIAVRKNGERFPIYLSIGDIDTSQKRLFAGVILDMSEQQRLQREILEIPVSEQRRIGQELHDGLGQQLTGLGLLATSLLNKASKPEYELAAQLARGLQEALSQLRALSRGLVPVDVDSGRFVDALETLAENLHRQSGLEISLDVHEPVRVADNSSAMHLYRIVQEAANNAIKHANASQIEIAVGSEGERGYLSVRDDGSGFDTATEDPQGLGLRIMKYRCELIDAELVVRAANAEGCEIKCYFAIEDSPG
jgi:two-component system CheB/CheR fusion protein